MNRQRPEVWKCSQGGEARKDACYFSSIKQDSGGEEEKLLRHDIGPTSHTRNARNKGTHQIKNENPVK